MRIDDADNLAQALLYVFDREYQIRVIGDNHCDVAIAEVTIDQQVAGEIYVRALFFGFIPELFQVRRRVSCGASSLELPK